MFGLRDVSDVLDLQKPQKSSPFLLRRASSRRSEIQKFVSSPDFFFVDFCLDSAKMA